MSPLRLVSHPLSFGFPFLIALCLIIIGLQWFLEPNPRTTISGSVDRKTNPIDGVARENPVALDDEYSPGQSPQASAREAFGKLPFSFEVNRGQTDPQVRFLSRGLGYNLFLTSTETVLSLSAPSSGGKGSPGREMDQVLRSRPRETSSKVKQNSSPRDLVRMRLIGADPAAQTSGLNELPGKSNYFIGNDPKKWLTDVAHYAGVQYKDVYDGVDLIYYANQRQLEYDFVVAPGADPGIIRMAYKGVRHMDIDKEGSLALDLSNGQLKQDRPLVYQVVNQTRKEVSGRFIISGKAEVSFEIGEYDSSKPLIIDPAFVFSTYLGGGRDDVGFAIAPDSAGNSYVAGRTLSTNFPTVNPYRSFNSGLNDIFVTKLNSAGSAVLYSTYIGGLGDDQAFSIAVNSAGEAYLTGFTTSTNFPLLDALQPFYGGGFSDGFLVRLNSSGNGLITSTYAGGSGEDGGSGIALDNAGNIYGIGYTNSTDLVTINSIQPFNAGGFDGFLLKLPPSGNSILFSTYAGGSGDDFGNAIAVDSQGFVYAIGDTFSTNLATVNALQPANAGGVDAFIAKLTPAGTSIVFATYCGGSGTDSGTSISLDGSGNIYALGYTNSPNFPPSISAAQPTKALGFDAYIRKLSTNGTTVLYSTFLGGNSNDAAYDIATDSAGNAYIIGETFSTNFPLMNPLKSAYEGARDVFVTKLSPAGNTILFSTYLGGGGDDNGFGIAADENGNAYLTGRTASSNFLTANAFQPSRQGGYDLFVAKLITTGAPTPPSTPTPTPTPTPGACTINNGGLNPQALSESGVAAPAGFSWSELQHDAGNLTQANGLVGVSPQQGSFRLADNFTIAQPCTFTSVVFFAYQTGAPLSPSPFAGYTLQIHNGRPGDVGSTVVFGDTTTNRLASSVDSKFFRISNTAVPPPGVATGTTRKLWMNTVNINTTLPAGTYWLDWASTATNGQAHFQPTKTIAVARGAAADNARQLIVGTGVWIDTLDSGNPGDAPDVPQDFPFVLNGTAPQWEPVVLTASEVEIKTWTFQGTTYAYLKLSFPNAGYRVVNFGLATRAGNDFTGDASVERFTGASVQAVTTTAGIYDLGALTPGSYNFIFKNTGSVVKTQPFTVAAPPFPANPIDNAREFVKQQYRDFLNREADPAGEDFWTDNITKCSDPARRPPGQTEAQCTLRQRETTSGAFFLSPEFQYTGYFVHRMYQGALGRQPKLSEFVPDAQFVGAGILVNGQLSGAKINQNKADFAQQFVNCTDATKSRCAEFKAIYDGLKNQQYVDKLFQTTGITPTTSERAALVNGLNAIPATETRASVLQKVVDGIFVISEGNQRFDTSYGQAFYNAESNRAFVLLEYFGYMKRDPDDAGYAFWLGKLNQFGGNFVNAEMVLAFISSPEYRARFGQP